MFKVEVAILDRARLSEDCEFVKTCSTRKIDWSAWNADIPATLMFIIQDDKILLIEKLTGIGEGKINGPGGKIDAGETPLQAVIRECQEELHITPTNPTKGGELWFDMNHIPNIHCHVYFATEFTGTPTSTREANPLWTKIEDIPYHKMWEDDQYWLPQAIKGQLFNGKFVFDQESIISKDVVFGKEACELWRG